MDEPSGWDIIAFLLSFPIGFLGIFIMLISVMFGWMIHPMLAVIGLLVGFAVLYLASQMMLGDALDTAAVFLTGAPTVKGWV